MLSRIGTGTENLPRCLTTRKPTSSMPGRSSRLKDNSNKTNKQSPLTLYSTAIAAQGDLGQSNNDDVVGKELDEDWRSVRAKLVAMEHNGSLAPELGTSWAHELAQPEKGCLLVCRREGLGFFHQAVVFILAHDDAKSTVGLVLNSPSPSLLQDAFARGWEPGKFTSERIYFGGPVEMNSLHILHSHGELEKCTEVIDGIYVGGFEDAQAMVEANTIPPSDFKLLVGYSSWGPYQLAQEIDDKCWHVLSTSTDLILQKAQDSDRESFNESLWEQVLELSGLERPF